MILEQDWAGYLVVVATSSLIPFEIYEIARRPTPSALLVLLSQRRHRDLFDFDPQKRALAAVTRSAARAMISKMLRFGLCCIFRDQPIRFVNTTAKSIAHLPRSDALAKLSRLCLSNADALLAALEFCAAREIGCFRINSQILPLKTHPRHGYAIDDLAEGSQIVARFQACGAFARNANVRTSFHPDQFVVLNSPRRRLSRPRYPSWNINLRSPSGSVPMW